MPAAPPDIYERALAEGAPMLAQLANAALLALDKGEADPHEAYAIAGLYTRMAGEREEPAAGHGHAMHAEVMLLRERFDRENGNDGRAVVAGAFAMRSLTRAADDGNDVAATRLSEIAAKLLPGSIAMAKQWETPAGAAEQEGYDAVLRAAAQGDPDALISVMQEAIIGHQDGVLTPLEALAIGEQCGRLGMAARHCHVAVRLSGVLLSRGDLERSAGHDDIATSKEAHGILVMSVLARSGHPGADELLSRMLELAPIKSAALASQGDPTILSGLPVQGTS